MIRKALRLVGCITVGIAASSVLTLSLGGASGAATPSSKRVPPTYVQILTTRLTKEFEDPTLATEVVASLDPTLVAQLQTEVPAGALKTSPLLSYRPSKYSLPKSSVGSVIAFEFGYELAPDGTTSAGPTNAAIAASVEGFATKHHVPIFAQQRIAENLTADGVPDVTSINPVDGTYLSTAGVVAQAIADATSTGTALGQVGIFGFADHSGRCTLTAEDAGLTAGVPKGIKLPTTYDPASAQSWTTNRLSYLEVDLFDRIETLGSP